MADDKKSLRCSFCGKAENQVHRMIQGLACASATSASSCACPFWTMGTSPA